ncbi:hypothetical protein GCM10027280_43910 [Micromonospora polyrhachis]|uniref:Knr4/Smi1-like domain-containing protein n=1 Tax=Micromonospora polyrhachis TaxID=1282883 RepID=A0A7W7SUU2_9ACTN|nr:SMI1/KNR4 family protein [Micromonospora polyrhachis]MBB4961349.1 hypothetical protein [Micromonospora polyrhachis]
MEPDLTLLRELVEGTPILSTHPGRGVPEEWICQVEAMLGPLPPSYRWWLTEYGSGTLGGAGIATIAPPNLRVYADDDLTAPWRLADGLLCFYAEPDCGDSYHFVHPGHRSPGSVASAEWPVVRRDVFGDEEPFAESFAGFLSISVARAAGLGDGPTPALARLWRSTPGVLLPNGVMIYGPQIITERNETYEVDDYAPHWVLIGDDSGGGGLFMRRHGRDRASVHHLDFGAISSDTVAASEKVADDLLVWLRGGAAIPGRQSTLGQ